MGILSSIEKAVEIMGSEAKLGRAAGFSQVAINRAKHRGSVSAEMAAGIDRATGGVVSKQDLRPDLFGPSEQSPREPANS